MQNDDYVQIHKTQLMIFSVVIPTYKRQQSLSDCLNCLAHYFDPEAQESLGFQVEVIISDDGREADLMSHLMNNYPWCHYVGGPQRGPAANRNHGAQQARGDWLVFTDDDCLPQSGWLEAYAASADECDVIEGGTSAVGRRTRLDEECPINELGGFLWSCNFAMRREPFLELGGFNEEFPAAAMEDAELNVRVNKAGLKRKFVPNAAVFHPWRLRKGLQYAKAHSYSVAKFVSLHPEMAYRFSLVHQLKNILRSFKRNVCLAVSTGQCRGLPRQIYLDCYSYFQVLIALRQIQ